MIHHHEVTAFQWHLCDSQLLLYNMYACIHVVHVIYQYSNKAPRLSGQTSIFDGVFSVPKSLLGIDTPKNLEKSTILTQKPWSHVRISIYQNEAYLCIIITSKQSTRHIRPSPISRRYFFLLLIKMDFFTIRKERITLKNT